MGLKVRLEPLDGQQASWCVIGGVPTVFVDLSQTAAEQLQQLEESLAAYLCEIGKSTSAKPTKHAGRHASDRAA